MKLDISTWMMIFFIIAFIISIWKVYAFLPNKILEDDDTTTEAQEQLALIMINTIKKHNADLTIDELYVFMIESQDFNSEKFWRFNSNKLRNLLNSYYLQNSHTKSIADIYNKL